METVVSDRAVIGSWPPLMVSGLRDSGSDGLLSLGRSLLGIIPYCYDIVADPDCRPTESKKVARRAQQKQWKKPQ